MVKQQDAARSPSGNQQSAAIRRHGRETVRLRKDLRAWAIMLPSLALFAFFVWVPLLESVRMSLYNTQGVRTLDFVGFANYLRVFAHPSFSPALRNTFIYIFWSLLIGFWTPILIAALITEAVRLKGLFRVGVYFPNIVPGLATVFIWGYFFRPGGTGVLNILLDKIGIGNQMWLTNPRWTIPLIVITMTWKAAGSTALIYMSAMSNISVDMYEAASIDGAKPFRRFISITLPCILSLGKTLLILQIIAVFQILYEPLVLTNGGPNNASISVMQLVYKYAFEDFNYGMATALSVLICIILAVLTVIYFRLTKSQEA